MGATGGGEGGGGGGATAGPADGGSVSDDGGGSGSDGGSEGGSGDRPGTTGADAGGETSTDAGSDGPATGDTGEPPAAGLPSLGSLVVLGDSIGDGGGVPPYYYDVLRDNLASHYGPIQYVNRAQSGSETGALLGQVQDLPASLPGPVAVVITSGGNDMKADILAVVTGADAALKMELQANIDAAHQALLAPGRFGPGVEVHIFEGNIYDASDGMGDFGLNGCAFGQGYPPIASDPIFEGWNDAIAQTVEGNGQVAVDMHADFYGHGYHAGEGDWYASDCTHPNATGHGELADLFYSRITGG